MFKNNRIKDVYKIIVTITIFGPFKKLILNNLFPTRIVKFLFTD